MEKETPTHTTRDREKMEPLKTTNPIHNTIREMIRMNKDTGKWCE
jgi:hypothetical protein